MNNLSNILVQEKELILNFLKARFPLFHNSNFFHRDLQYGLRSYFEKKGIELTYPQAEKLANEFANILENEQIFTKINNSVWRLNYPEFTTSTPGDPFQF